MNARKPGSGDPILLGHRGLAFLLNQATRAVDAEFDEDLRDRDLTHGGLVVLRNMLRDAPACPEGVSVAEMSERLIIPLDRLIAEVGRLEKSGWLTRAGRGASTTVLPTPKAEAVLPVLQDTTRWTMERAMNGVSAEEIETLSRLLRTMITNLGHYAGPEA